MTVRLGRLYSPDVAALLAREFGGARTVPALRIQDGGAAFALWDTLAMAETLAERHPERGLWPAAPAARAMARTLAAEMHSSFSALRSACPMNLRRCLRGLRARPGACGRTWRGSRRCGGWRGRRTAADAPWLFGAYSLADVFFAPVAARVATYGLPMGEAAMRLCGGASRRPGVPGVAGGRAGRSLRAAALRPRPAGAALAGAVRLIRPKLRPRLGRRASIQPTMSASTPSLPMSFRRSW